jgi:hypothetical protein
MDHSKVAEQAMSDASEAAVERQATGLVFLAFGAGCFALGLVIGASVMAFAWAVVT